MEDHEESVAPDVEGQSGQADDAPRSPAADDRPSRDINDETTISIRPPLTRPAAHAGMHPFELGHALEGESLGQFRLDEFIGGGGMGAVFRASDLDLNRTVAVKVLSKYQGEDTASERRFQLEAQSAARLDHPNIASVYHIGHEGDIHFIVLEYVEGINVRDIVRQRGLLTVSESLSCVLQIANALAHAWQRGVVHRDIKPSNILLTAELRAMLVDMGLARLAHVDQRSDDVTASGVTLGTFDYISPEQARNPSAADTRSDIYSLGCTLFYMLAGRPPFPQGTVVEKLLRHQSEPPPSLAHFRHDVPASVEHLLTRMLAKRPEDRPQDPRELQAQLLRIHQQLNLPLPPSLVPATWGLPRRRPPRWVRAVPIFVPVGLLIAGVLALSYMGRGTVEPEPFEPLQTLPTPDAAADTEPAESPQEEPLLPAGTTSD